MLFTNEKRMNFAKDPAVAYFAGRYYLYYTIRCPEIPQTGFGMGIGVGIAVSDDGDHFTNVAEVPRTQEPEKNGIGAPAVIAVGDTLHLYYQTYGNGAKDAICHAVSKDGIHFEKDPRNPVFAPTADWCCGRAIDADVCLFQGKLFLYFATRDHEMKIQKVGVAVSEDFSHFTQVVPQAILAPEFLWEKACIEAPATVENDGLLYLFYGGAYNCSPQQIGYAVSKDGVHFDKKCPAPFITNGPEGSWNQSESGHPYAFRAPDGKAYLYYQGSADGGKTWYLSRVELLFAPDGTVTYR